MVYFQDSEYKNKANCDPKAIQANEDFRSEINRRIRLLQDYAEGGHAPSSWHYKGKAFDESFIDACPLWLFMEVAMKHFTGIGLYLDAVTKVIKYIHVDIRDTEPTMWIAILEKDGTVNLDGSDYIYKIGQ